MSDIDVPALAAVTGIPEKTLWKLVRHARLPHYRVGRSIRFTPDHVRQIREAVRTDSERARREQKGTKGHQTEPKETRP